MSCVTQIVADKLFETGITQKIIVDSDNTQHLIANNNFISNYYDEYSKYQTRS